jgi:phosphoglycerol transferase
MVADDKQLVSTMEARLPPSAMVFQLPVMEFPEVPALLGVSDYESFRPYFFSRHLHFSYGSHKGRYRQRWQKEAESLGAPALVRLLENYGFSAVLINRKGYQDGARSLLADFQSIGRSTVVAESSDSVCIQLKPSDRPVLPPEFDGNWYDLEGDRNNNWRWSSGNATIVLENPGPRDQVVHVTAGLATARPRYLQVLLGSRKLYGGFLVPNQTKASLDVAIALPPGKTQLQFITDAPAESPGHGDSRKLAYNITNFNVVSE